MNPTTALRMAAAAVWVLAHALAAAYPAQAVGDINQRAGPARDFPVVRTLASGTTVDVVGCESDYQWCDVDAEGQRGWVYARYLEATFDDRPVIVAQQGATLGLPVLSFALGVYWASHYRDRHWYERRQQWQQWNYWPRPPGWTPRPPPRPPRPPVIILPPPRPSGALAPWGPPSGARPPPRPPRPHQQRPPPRPQPRGYPN